MTILNPDKFCFPASAAIVLLELVMLLLTADFEFVSGWLAPCKGILFVQYNL